MDTDPKTSGIRWDSKCAYGRTLWTHTNDRIRQGIKKVFRENHLANVTYPRGRRYPSPLLEFQSSTWTIRKYRIKTTIRISMCHKSDPIRGSAALSYSVASLTPSPNKCTVWGGGGFLDTIHLVNNEIQIQGPASPTKLILEGSGTSSKSTIAADSFNRYLKQCCRSGIKSFFYSWIREGKNPNPGSRMNI